MDIQKQQWNHQEPIRSQPDLRHPSCNGLTNHQLENEDPISQQPIKKQPPFRSLACEKSLKTAPVQSRSPLPVQPNDQSAAPQNACQRALSVNSVSTQPIPPVSSITPEKRLSKPSWFDNLLNPTAGINNGDSGRSNNGNKADSHDMAPIPQLATPSLPPFCVRNHSLEDNTLPSIKPAPSNKSLHLLSHTTTPVSPAARGPGFTTAGLPSATTDKRQLAFVSLQNLTEPVTAPSTSEPQSIISPPFVSGAPSQSQQQMMILDMAGGAIQVPCDFQSASKVADEKRKRIATASHRFRLRRKVREQETANIIPGWEAQVRQLNKENEFLQNMLRQHGIITPSGTPSPIQKHVSIGGSLSQGTETSASNAGGNTLELTNEYFPAQGFPPQRSVPFKHMQMF